MMKKCILNFWNERRFSFDLTPPLLARPLSPRRVTTFFVSRLLCYHKAWVLSPKGVEATRTPWDQNGDVTRLGGKKVNKRDSQRSKITQSKKNYMQNVQVLCARFTRTMRGCIRLKEASRP